MAAFLRLKDFSALSTGQVSHSGLQELTLCFGYVAYCSQGAADPKKSLEFDFCSLVLLTEKLLLISLDTLQGSNEIFFFRCLNTL